MDALKMLKTLKRYCKHVGSCCVCEIGGETCLFDSVPEHMNVALMEDTVSFLEHWEREHPAKTRAEIFIERNPDAARSVTGLPLVRPCDYIGDKMTIEECERYDNCAECIEKFWEEPAPEEG